ncbi:MAG: polyphosphate:AMP phosphotransferase [Oscillospiraceae bacterium]|nr:polyphosphate:AMP phosphotransferase [Oscillospiraceae bacterium]
MLEQIQQKKAKGLETDEELSAMREELITLANAAKEHKLPVIITIDGWSAAGKGSQIAKLIKYMDPRFYNVESIRDANDTERRMPWMHRFWLRLPAKGNFLILDGSWYRDTINGYMKGTLDKSEYKQRIEDINTFERQLTDDGYLLIKLFLHIDRDEQERRLKKLMSSEITRWRVNDLDLENNKKYDKYLKCYDKTLSRTNTSFAPWNVIPANDKKGSQYAIMKTVTESIKAACAAAGQGERYVPAPMFPVTEYAPVTFKMHPVKKLCDVDMDKSLTDEEYAAKLEKYQNMLFELQSRCYQRKIPVVIAYEGWDAGGKGGNIKRVASALDPRGYEVKPIAAPEPSELARHYLWRFWKRLEKDGHFTIFDRTWYGRVMVEPIEHITPAERADMAYREINEFEQQLDRWGAVVIKFWINIDKEEQYRRFKERENTPSKQWKITDEDWRNREKWDEYEKAVDRMTALTSTDFAPWTIIEGNDKKYARIKALKTICGRLEERLLSSDD